ncbi:MAG: DUF4232 domain-containing protein [Propionicimonas sp.]
MRWRWVGWTTLPVLGLLAVVGAHRLRLWVVSGMTGPQWRGLDWWFPDVVPAVMSYAVDPWPQQLTRSGALVLALLLTLAAFLALSAVPPQRRLLRFVLLWAGVALAVVVTVGAVEVGQILLEIERFGGRGGHHLRNQTVPLLREALHWALLWGWAPALLTTLISPPRPARSRWVILGVTAVLLSGAVASGVWLARTAHDTALSTATEVRQPEPQPPSDPPAPVNPDADPAFDGRCPAESLALDFGITDGALGVRFAQVTAVNTSTNACSLRGRPDLALAAADGNVVRPSLVPGQVMTEGGATEALVVLEPGHSARAELRWRAGGGAEDRTATDVWVAPWAGAKRQVVAHPIDVVDGTEITISAWLAAE